MQHDDHKYIKALANNDSKLISEIYQRYFYTVKKLVIQNNGSEMDAADVFQEAIIELHKKALAGFELTCPLGGFLHLLCKNRWINELKKRKRLCYKGSIVEAALPDEPVNEAPEQFDLKKALVVEALDSMEEHHRRLLLVTWTGQPLKEVAVSMNFTYGYLRKKKTECMAKLIAIVRQSEKFKYITEYCAAAS